MQQYCRLIIIVLLFPALVYGQKKQNHEDKRLFDQAILLSDLMNDELDLNNAIYSKDTTDIKDKIRAEYAQEIKDDILEKTLDLYTELVDSFPKSALLLRALNNKAFIEYELEYYKEAKESYLRILNSNANDKERGGVGKGLMGEPYANFKNRAATMLAKISLHDSNYKDAIRYLDETKKYPYQHFCGNEHAANRLESHNMYAKCYLGLKDSSKAYSILIPDLIYNGLADNSFLVKTTHEALLINYTNKQLKEKFEDAVANYHTEKTATKSGENTEYYILYLGSKIYIQSAYVEFAKEGEKENLIKSTFLKSEFYNLVSK